MSFRKLLGPKLVAIKYFAVQSIDVAFGALFYVALLYIELFFHFKMKNHFYWFVEQSLMQRSNYCADFAMCPSDVGQKEFLLIITLDYQNFTHNNLNILLRKGRIKLQVTEYHHTDIYMP